MSETGIEAEALAGAVCPACGAAFGGGEKPLAQVTCSACGAQVMVPGKLGQYRLVRLIGAGGMGAVYEGFDDGLQRKVAVKVILREKAAEDPSFIESFRHEAQAAAKLNSTNIVGVYAFGEVAAQPYLVMELVQPSSLDRLMNDGPVNAMTVLDVGRQIAQGLRAAAEQGLVHGDVKPENILINEAHEAKLADFGIAALAGAKAAANNEVWGTPYYIAPETLRKQKVDLRADIYSLGATLYHAIAGVPPFEGADAVEVMKGRLLGPARPLTEVAPSCPEAVAKIIMRMLEAEPIRRYPNYESLLADIEKVAPASRGHVGGKKITIKGKTQAIKSTTGPSRPMERVESPNAPLFPEKQGGLGKGALIGIVAGAAVLLLAIIGGAIAVIASSAKEASGEAAPDAGALEAELAAQNAAAQAKQQLTSARTALTEATAQAAKVAQEAKSNAATAKAIVRQLVQQAKRAVLPDQAAWLEPMEGEEPAPSELLKKVQEAFGHQAALEAAAKQAEALRTKVDGLAAAEPETPEAAAEAAQEATGALEAWAASPEAKAAAKALTALKAMQNAWKRTVDQGRAEMEATVAKRLAEEKAAKAAAAAAAEAERKQQEMEAEVASVAQAEVAIGAELDRFLPEAAAEAFKAKTARCKSAEAKAAAETALARIAVYTRLKAWIIREAGAGKLAGYGITAADAHGITLKGQAQPLQWRDFVGAQQKLAVRLFTGLIASDSGARALKASERADLAVGAVVFTRRYIGEEAIGKSKSLREMLEKLETLANALPGSKADLELFGSAE
ncbi:MAG: serine/threonine-protein kinase [Candidatus Spyradenecus sp.]